MENEDEERWNRLLLWKERKRKQEQENRDKQADDDKIGKEEQELISDNWRSKLAKQKAEKTGEVREDKDGVVKWLHNQ